LTELAVDGVEPTDDNIIHGKYAIWSYEHMFTLGPPTGEVSRFIAFVQSNSALVKQDGFILIRDMRVTETDR
jgi:phosphate transport system substrate-binding protein